MDQLLDAEVIEESDVTVERISDLGDRVLVLERETYVGRASGVRPRLESAPSTGSWTVGSSTFGVS